MRWPRTEWALEPELPLVPGDSPLQTKTLTGECGERYTATACTVPWLCLNWTCLQGSQSSPFHEHKIHSESASSKLMRVVLEPAMYLQTQDVGSMKGQG